MLCQVPPFSSWSASKSLCFYLLVAFSPLPLHWVLSTPVLGLFSIPCLKGNMNATFIFCYIRDPYNGFTTECVELTNDLNINENVFQNNVPTPCASEYSLACHLILLVVCKILSGKS